MARPDLIVPTRLTFGSRWRIIRLMLRKPWTIRVSVRLLIWTRVKAIVECVWHGFMPPAIERWRTGEIHYAPWTWREHLAENMGYAWRLLTFRDIPVGIDIKTTIISWEGPVPTTIEIDEEIPGEFP